MDGPHCDFEPLLPGVPKGICRVYGQRAKPNETDLNAYATPSLPRWGGVPHDGVRWMSQPLQG